MNDINHPEICPKCHTNSGDAWTQCSGSCPVPCSPHFKPTAISKIATHNEFGEIEIRLDQDGYLYYVRMGFAGRDCDWQNVKTRSCRDASEAVVEVPWQWAHASPFPQVATSSSTGAIEDPTEPVPEAIMVQNGRELGAGPTFCPYCGTKTLVADGSVFIEEGEFDTSAKQAYDNEGDRSVYRCTTCDTRFAADIGKCP